MANKYEDSGVSVERGYETISRIKKHIHQTINKGVMSDVGSFGSLFDLGQYNYKHPVLVSGTDGVGTKLLIAQKANKHHTIGIDLVAMCVNDIVTTGAEPLFFLDYIASGYTDPKVIEEIVEGISVGCIASGAALVGGETAEMPGMYQKKHYDLAGYVTGVVEKEKIISNEGMTKDQLIVGLASSGIHSNGYSLVRKIFFEDYHYNLEDYIEALDAKLQDVLLEPTRIYVKSILALIKEVNVTGIAHITGGGFIENIPRALKEGYSFSIDKNKVPVKPIFKVMQQLGQIEEDDMYNIFNMGIGMVVVIDKNDLEKTLTILKAFGEEPYVIGKIIESKDWELI